jgi:hypothetical protein
MVDFKVIENVILNSLSVNVKDVDISWSLYECKGYINNSLINIFKHLPSDIFPLCHLMVNTSLFDKLTNIDKNDKFNPACTGVHEILTYQFIKVIKSINKLHGNNGNIFEDYEDYIKTVKIFNDTIKDKINEFNQNVGPWGYFQLLSNLNLIKLMINANSDILQNIIKRNVSEIDYLTNELNELMNRPNKFKKAIDLLKKINTKDFYKLGYDIANKFDS